MTVALLLAAAALVVWPAGGAGARHRPSPPRSAGLTAPQLGGASAAAVLLLAWALAGNGPAGLLGVPAAALVARLVPALAARSRSPAAVPAELPLTLDVAAAALRAGQPVAAALRLGTWGLPDSPLTRVSRLLELGAEPAEAWSAVGETGPLASLAAAARRSSSSGIRLATTFDQVAAQLRRDRRATAEARAQRVGVLVMAPLGLCFLPAFVCLGVVPAVGGLVSAVWSGVAR